MPILAWSNLVETCLKITMLHVVLQLHLPLLCLSNVFLPFPGSQFELQPWLAASPTWSDMIPDVLSCCTTFYM